jgi:hypothetical protein
MWIEITSKENKTMMKRECNSIKVILKEHYVVILTSGVVGDTRIINIDQIRDIEGEFDIEDSGRVANG